MNEYYIGLMSGTSLDGVDAALVNFQANHPPKLVDCFYQPYPGEIVEALTQLLTPGKNEIDQLGQIDIRLGKLFAGATIKLINKTKICRGQIKAIGSHGQTLRHRPSLQHPFTLQIGDPNTIAELTKITTIADFRRRDMAAGGQGAPLVPAFHQVLFADHVNNNVVVNIGGIANITVLEKKQTTLGFDTGPGNSLMNTWTQRHLNTSFDANGNWARQGKVHQELLAIMLNDDYFSILPPKSTGREYFDEKWLMQQCEKVNDVTPVDIQTTLLELTVVTISQAIKKYVTDAANIIVCGGGANNRFLLEKLQQAFPSKPVSTSKQVIDVDPDWIEAMAFAWLAKQTLNNSTGNVCTVTGAHGERVLGGIYQSQ